MDPIPTINFDENDRILFSNEDDPSYLVYLSKSTGKLYLQTGPIYSTALSDQKIIDSFNQKIKERYEKM